MSVIHPAIRHIGAFTWPFAAGLSTAFSIVFITRGEVASAVAMGVIAVLDIAVHIIFNFVVNKQN